MDRTFAGMSRAKALFIFVAGMALVGGATSAQAYQVKSGRIYDDQGQRVPLRGVNWFGFETESHAPHGLWARSVDSMIAQMKSMGINAVRLPLSPATLHGAPVSKVDHGLNPQLVDMNALQLLDYVVHALDASGMFILLDHHRPDDEAISELWYTGHYSEQQWLDDLKLLATRYKDVSHVVGIDLKNEPHGSATWGAGDPAMDWNLAAERAARVVLAANGKLLVFVAGVAEQSSCSSARTHGWGGNLEPLRCKPLDIPRDKLVLAPHFYGPDVYMHPYFNDALFPGNMPAIWQEHFGFARDLGYAVVPTEFGSRYGHGGLELDKQWFDAAVEWMKRKDLRDGFYWSWNPNSADTGGLLKDDWHGAWGDKLARLQQLWGVTAPAPMLALASATEFSPATLVGDEYTVERIVNSDWGAGYCVTYTVSNVSKRVAPWAIYFGFFDTLDKTWGAAIRGEDTLIRISGDGQNARLAPGQKTAFGYCATRPSPLIGGLPLGELPAELSSQSDWGGGYCMQVRVVNASVAMTPWRTTFPMEGRITRIWNANIQPAGEGKVQAVGLEWNAYLSPGASAVFGFCAER